MTSLDAYKMQRLKTKIFSLLSQSLPKVKKKKNKDAEIVHTIFYYPIQYLLRKSNLIKHTCTKDKFFEVRRRGKN